jgi:hypothetical protein
MNDATRELGAALGVAVMGSIAASKYSGAIHHLTSGLSGPAQRTARSSLAGALRVASQQPATAGHALSRGAQLAFIDGIHLAVTVGAALAWMAAVIVLRNLPNRLAHQGAMRGATDAVEDVLELGLGGVEPVFADRRFSGNDRLATNDSARLTP